MLNPFRLPKAILSLLIAASLALFLPYHVAADDGSDPLLEEEPAPPPIEEGSPLEADIAIAEEDLVSDPLADLQDGLIAADAVGEDEQNPMIAVEEVGDTAVISNDLTDETQIAGDPIWCPSSVTVPKPSLNGCSGSFDSLAALFAELAEAPKTSDGVIWIAQDYDSNVDATLDGDPVGPLAVMRNFKLTIKGGWVGCGETPPATCSGVIQTAFPSELNHALSILNWNNDISISDIWIIDSASSGIAFQVETTGKIVLTRVEVRDNAGAGADLDNSAGTKDVVVTSSKFTGNQGGDGLSVVSRGAITLSNVIANGNAGDGVSLINEDALSAKGVVLTSGLFQFNDNSGSGLVIESRGSLTLKDITAVGNDVNGASLDNTASTNASIVTLAGTNIFSENDNHGLLVLSKGAIKANNLVNNANGEYGARLDNTDATSAQSIILTTRNDFKFNGGGLKIESNGAISLANVTATNNSLYEGASLNNFASTVGSPVTMTGANVFTFNRLEGLVVISKGAITISNLTASFNGQGAVPDHGSGAWLDNSESASPKTVKLTGTNSFIDNYEFGLHVLSKGAISLAGLSASQNIASGVHLDNLASLETAPQNILISGAATFSGNGGNGLYIDTFGAITLNGAVAVGNGGTGAVLDNSTGALKRDIILKGINNFSDNGTTGLSISSLSTVTINQLTASFNNSAGAVLSNDFPGSSGSLNLTGISLLSNNGANGLTIDTRGNIKIGKLTADSNQAKGASLTGEGSGSITVGINSANWCNSLSDNRNTGLEINGKGPIILNSLCNSGNGLALFMGYGAEMDNSGAASLQPVTLNGVNSFVNNYTGGIWIVSKGAIKGSNIDASNNTHGNGAVFDNRDSTVGSPQNVTLVGVNKLSVNYSTGLKIETYGAITLSRVTAGSNGYGTGDGYGAYLDNQTDTITPKPVKLAGANSFSNNTEDGLWIESLGAITVEILSANSNEGNGAYLQNTAGGAVGNIAITGRAEFLTNQGNGLDALSLGKISIANLEAVFNDGYGAYLNNSSASPAQGVVLSGANTFDQNDEYGLYVLTRGAILASNLRAWNNEDWGVKLDNSAAGAAATVSVAGKQHIGGNGKVGLEIYSNRAITISNLASSFNDEEGAVIDTTSAGIPQNVILSGVSKFETNGLTGLKIETLGAVALSNLTATGNGFDPDALLAQHGVFIDNQTGASVPKGVMLTGASSFAGNHDDGLHIESLGLIKLASVTASSNGANGAYLDNYVDNAVGGVTLTGINLFEQNGALGLEIISHGAVALANIAANANLAGGADIFAVAEDNMPAVSVKLTGINAFNYNGDEAEGSGLKVYSDGNITLSNVAAIGNQFRGVWLNNTTYATGAPTISITNGNFSGNLNTGLYFASAGSVSLSQIVADGNGGEGINGNALGNITVTCASLTANDGFGWQFNSTGTVTLKGVFAYGNWINENEMLGEFIYVRSC